MHGAVHLELLPSELQHGARPERDGWPPRMGAPSTVSTVSPEETSHSASGRVQSYDPERGDGRFFCDDTDPSSNLRGEDGPRLLRRDEEQENFTIGVLSTGRGHSPTFSWRRRCVLCDAGGGKASGQGARRGEGRFPVGFGSGTPPPAGTTLATFFVLSCDADSASASESADRRRSRERSRRTCLPPWGCRARPWRCARTVGRSLARRRRRAS